MGPAQNWDTPLYLYIERTDVSRWSRILTATRLPMAENWAERRCGKDRSSDKWRNNEWKKASARWEKEVSWDRARISTATKSRYYSPRSDWRGFTPLLRLASGPTLWLIIIQDLLSMRQMWIIAEQAGWVKHSNNRLASFCIICLRSRLADVLSRRISFPQFVSRDLPSMHIQCYRGHEIIRGSSHAPIYDYIIGI